MSAVSLVQRVTLTSNQATITVSNIPQDGDDLLITLSSRGNRTETLEVGRLYFNGVTGNWFSRQFIGFGTGSGYTETDPAGTYGIFYSVNGSTSSANTFGSTEIYVPNYASSATKMVSIDGIFENNAAGGWQNFTACRWNQTAAITSVTVGVEHGTQYLTGSSLSIYKITKGTSGGVTV